jgi:aryl-alcohol dehydrogenase-like predicted oxidoreductase
MTTAQLTAARLGGIGVSAYSPMGSGILTGGMSRERVNGVADDDWRKHDARLNEPPLSLTLSLVNRLTRVAGTSTAGLGLTAKDLRDIDDERVG